MKTLRGKKNDRWTKTKIDGRKKAKRKALKQKIAAKNKERKRVKNVEKEKEDKK